MGYNVAQKGHSVQSRAQSTLLYKTQRPEKLRVFSSGNDVHNHSMTELLEQAFERVRALPPEQQDKLARVLLSLAGDEAVYQLTAEEEASLAKSRAQAARGEFASDEEVRAVWAKHGL